MHHRGGGWWGFFTYDESKGRPIVDRHLIRRVLGYARPYVGLVILLMILITLISVVELAPPLLYRDLIDNVLPNRDVSRLNLLAIAMIGIPLLSGLIGVGQRYVSARIGEGIIYDLRQSMYVHLGRMSIRFFTHTRAGEIISRFSSDVIGAQNAISGTLPNIVTNIVTLSTTLIVMMSIDWRLTLLSSVVLPLFIIPARRVGRILRRIRREAMEHNANLSSIISETLSINGALLVKIFGRQKAEVTRFSEINREVHDIGVRRALVGRWFFLGLGMASAIGTALIYWYGGHLVLGGDITIGTIVAFAAYLIRLYGPISSLSNVQVEFASSMVSFERVFEYLDLPIEIQDRTDAVHIKQTNSHIQFDNVSFSYLVDADETQREDKRDVERDGVDAMDHVMGPVATRRWALREVSFELQPGELTALVGPSGAGKTTVTYMLPRLYDPSEGIIRLDGRDLRDITLESLAHQIGMVTQETFLLHDTVRANLHFANQDASQAELEAACIAANIHDFIVGLPDGYDTVVGERGYRLSGGEKQRLSIARVILKDPCILILDEATSHLDSHSEALIQAALEPLLEGRTSLVIAHRLSTILAADQIIVLDDGRVVERGTHSDLLNNQGLYADLYETQFKREATIAKM